MFDWNWKLLLCCLSSFLSVLFAHFTIKMITLRKKYSHIPGPPTKGILGFYTGNLIELLVETRAKKKIMNEVFLRW